MSYKDLNPNSPHARKNLAGFWLRLSAGLIDILIIFIIVSILLPWLPPYLKDFMPHGFLTLDKNFPGVSYYLPVGDSPAIFTALWLAVTGLCYILPTTAYMQGTVGKWLVGIYVGDISGNRISFSTALLRFLCYAISLAPLGVGFFMIAVNREKRALHDIVCKTMVFKGTPTGAHWTGAEDDYINLYSRKEKVATEMGKAAAGEKKSVEW